MKFAKVMLLCIGILSIVMGAIVFMQYDGTTESNENYGGDAYTGIQNAAAKTASNVMHAAKIIRIFGGSLLVIIGLLCFTGVFLIRPREVVVKSSPVNNTRHQTPSITPSVSHRSSTGSIKGQIEKLHNDGIISGGSYVKLLNADLKSFDADAMYSYGYITYDEMQAIKENK